MATGHPREHWGYPDIGGRAWHRRPNATRPHSSGDCLELLIIAHAELAANAAA